MKNSPVRKVMKVNLVLLKVFCMQVPAGTSEKLFFYITRKSKKESKSRNNSLIDLRGKRKDKKRNCCSNIKF